MNIRKILVFARSKLRKLSGRRGKGEVDKSQPEEAGIEKTEGRKAGQENQKRVASSAGRKKKKKPWSVKEFDVPPMPGKSRFHDLSLPLSLMRGIAALDFRYCTPIQEKVLPEALNGSDIVGQANTGTGKSAVFLITLISRLVRERKKIETGFPRSLVIAPTRELVTQIARDGKKLALFTPLRIMAVYGGADYNRQIELLETKRCDIMVATPGRLLDFISKDIVNLSRTDLLVLDEADRLLDMGFIPDVRRIVNRMVERKKRQTMLFSATISEDVKRLVYSWCHEPVVIEVTPEQVAVDTVEQLTYMVSGEEKYKVLYNLVTKNRASSIMVFVNQKNEAKRLAERLGRNGIDCQLLTGDVPQKKRERRLEGFRSGRSKVLVATDVAGRGIHIDNVAFVVNYTLPYEPEDYVHRIGRTGRAGASGVSVSFACEKGSFFIPDIEEYIGRKLECEVPPEELLIEPPPLKPVGQRKSGYKKTGRRSSLGRKRNGRRRG